MKTSMHFSRYVAVKQLHLPVVIILACMAFLSCREDSRTPESYIYFSLDGPTWSGEYRLRESDDPHIINITGLIYPAVDDGEETSIISFQDFDQGISVGLYAPAKTGLAILREDISGDFPWSMAITRHSDGVILGSSEVSINMTKFRRGGNSGIIFHQIREAVANFDGVMKYYTGEFDPNLGIEITEVHTISGDFKVYLE